MSRSTWVILGCMAVTPVTAGVTLLVAQQRATPLVALQTIKPEPHPPQAEPPAPKVELPPAPRQPTIVHRFGGTISAASQSPDGTRVAFAGGWPPVRVWHPPGTERWDALSDLPPRTDRVAWSPDGRLLAAAGYKTVVVWDTAAHRQKVDLKGHEDWVLAIAWSPDSKTLATASRANWDGTLKLWDVATGKVRAELDGHKESVKALAWSPDGTLLASASRDKTVRVWDAATGRGKAIVTFKDEVHVVAWALDGTTLIIPDGTMLKFADALTGEVKEVHYLGNPITSTAMAWSPDGRLLAVSKGTKIEVWDAARKQPMYPPLERNPDPWIEAVWWGRSDMSLSVAGQEGTIQTWAASSLR